MISISFNLPLSLSYSMSFSMSRAIIIPVVLAFFFFSFFSFLFFSSLLFLFVVYAAALLTRSFSLLLLTSLRSCTLRPLEPCDKMMANRCLLSLFSSTICSLLLLALHGQLTCFFSYMESLALTLEFTIFPELILSFDEYCID